MPATVTLARPLHGLAAAERGASASTNRLAATNDRGSTPLRETTASRSLRITSERAAARERRLNAGQRAAKMWQDAPREPSRPRGALGTCPAACPDEPSWPARREL